MTNVSDPDRQNSQCPYWVADSNNQCSLYRGGLFLPLEKHIIRYCQSSEYSVCQHYIRGCGGQEDVVRKHGLSLADSRRHYERLSKKLPVRLYACDHQGNTVALISDKAQTLDLSIGGLSMLSTAKLEQGQQVAVHFDAGFSIPGLSSKGEIRWCEPRGNDVFQAGLAFADGSSMGKVVGSLWESVQ